jgi:hypothetical protein
MFSWLKKYFIPHEGNANCPHILSDNGTRNIIAIVLFLEIFTFLVPVFTHINTTGDMATVLPAVLADLTNQDRQAQNLPPLVVSPLLNEAAQMKASDMATNGYFAHTSPDGKTPWYWLSQVGYNYQYAGENLAMNFNDSKDVADAWMASPMHRDNIVKENYTEVGTGVATGMYQGQETTFVVQDYANPLPAPVPTQAVSTKNGSKTTETKTNMVAVKKQTDVLGAETVITSANNSVTNIVASAPVSEPSFWQKLIASPRNTTNMILYAIFVMVLATLLFYVFIKIKSYRIDLITNGLVVLVVVATIFTSNYYLGYHKMVTTQGLDYSNPIL